MTKEEAEIRRAGYRAGWAQGKRDRKTEVEACFAELMQALKAALDSGPEDIDTEAHVVYERYAKKIKPKRGRIRKICKGSIVRWKDDGGYKGGTLTKFMRYEHGEGEVWQVTLVPSGQTVERLITLDMITKFGPKRRPGIRI